MLPLARLGAAAALALAASCSAPAPPEVATSERLFERTSEVTIGRETRRAWLVPRKAPHLRRLVLKPPPGARLEVGYGVPNESLQAKAAPASFVVDLDAGGTRRELHRRRIDPRNRREQHWFDLRIDLSEWADTQLAIELRLEPESGQSPDTAAARGAFSDAVLHAGSVHEARPNLIVLSIDTLRARSVSAYGYGRETTPFFDALTERGTLFEDAITTSVTTGPSHMSLFTGLYPVNHGLRTGLAVKAEGAVTAAEQLLGAGYHTAAFTENGYIVRQRGFGAGFTEYTENHGDRKRGPGEVRVTFAQALRWLERGPRRPFFLFVHTYEVHSPYAPPPRYAAHFEGDGFPGPEDAELHEQRDNYDREIRFVDDKLREFFTRLDEFGLAENTIVAIVSDHGEEFGEHGLFQHGGAVYEETLRIPLLLVGPGIPAGRRVAAPVSLIDVMPTLLSLVPVELPAGLDGMSLAPALGADPALPIRTLFAEARASRRWLRPRVGERWNPPLIAVRSPQGKFVVHRPEEGISRPTVRFDLESDALERAPQPVEGETLATLEALVDDYLKGRVDPAELASPDRPDGLDAGLRERLELLGYLEASE